MEETKTELSLKIWISAINNKNNAVALFQYLFENILIDLYKNGFVIIDTSTLIDNEFDKYDWLHSKKSLKFLVSKNTRLFNFLFQDIQRNDNFNDKLLHRLIFLLKIPTFETQLFKSIMKLEGHIGQSSNRESNYNENYKSNNFHHFLTLLTQAFLYAKFTYPSSQQNLPPKYFEKELQKTYSTNFETYMNKLLELNIQSFIDNYAQTDKTNITDIHNLISVNQKELTATISDFAMSNLIINKFIESNHSNTAEVAYRVISFNNHEVTNIESISDFLDMINVVPPNNNVSENHNTFSGMAMSKFFRGHSYYKWTMTPSILRATGSDSLRNKENLIYEESLTYNANDFTDLNSHLDILKKMQHYGVQTRLLDITSSLATAAFFACSEQKENPGEIIVFNASINNNIKNFKSDNVAVLTSIPAFSISKQTEIYATAFKYSLLNYAYTLFSQNGTTNYTKDFNNETIIKHLVHEISSEKNFSNVIDPDTMINIYFVQPTLDNDRVKNQRGAFVVFSANTIPILKQTDLLRIESLRYKASGRIQHFIIMPFNKDHVLSELALLGTDKKFIYPELQSIGDTYRTK
ncbi:FRG domain-containing protein [Leuconostoc mesenteroides]|uniref:FRG domain-containing protein n=1 Tax=Leuconostoc mesenteroides TaxID=1245 RepID=UPI00388971C9